MSSCPNFHVRPCCYQRIFTTSFPNYSGVGPDWTACIDVFLKLLKESMENLCISQVKSQTVLLKFVNAESCIFQRAGSTRQECTITGRQLNRP